MTDKFKPIFKQPFIPKTETRIFLGGRPIDQQVEKSNFKGVNKQPYQSERANEINPGYGPCYVCSKSTNWTDLYVRCPAVGCPSNNNNRSYWYHGWCGGIAKVSNKARIQCNNCGTSYHMSAWNFRCSEHKGDTDESVTRRSFNKCLGLALQNEDVSDVMADLGVYISNHKGEWPN